MSTLIALRDKAYGLAAQAVYARSMSMPLGRDEHTRFPMRVSAVVDLTPAVRRITFSAPELGDFSPVGPDEYFGLFMPALGHELPELPQDGSAIARGIFDHLPEAERPELRWYTVRSHRPEVGEIDVDIVTHGDAGPGSRWTLRARVGEIVGFQTGGAAHRTQTPPGTHVLIADDTAVPALATVLEQAPDDIPIHAVIETDDLANLPELPERPGARIEVVARGTGEPGSALLPALAAQQFAKPTFGWVCGEQTMVKEARRHLVDELGMDKRAVYHCAYWIQGRPRP